jgi:hypothetical protein
MSKVSTVANCTTAATEINAKDRQTPFEGEVKIDTWAPFGLHSTTKSYLTYADPGANY